MHKLAFYVFLLAQPEAAPIDFDRLTLHDAIPLDRKRVTITFTPGKPAYTWGAGRNLRTVAAPITGSPDRTVMLKGNRVRVADMGCDPLTVTGRLRVIQHHAAVVDGKVLGPWVEIRLEE